MKKVRISQLAVYFSTILILLVGFIPSVFKIPTGFQPWMFLASIAWFVAFCSGVFS